MTLLEAFGLVGGVASIAGFLYAILYARRSRRIKLLTYDTSASVPLATAHNPEDHYSLSVLFQRKDGPEERIKSVHVQFLRFANVGQEPIRRSDIAPASPLRICIDGARVLDIALSASSRQVANLEVKNVTLNSEHSHAEMAFDFLDYQDGGVVKILTEGGRARIRLEGDIIGMPEGIRRSDEVRSLGILNTIGCSLGVILQIAALTLAVFAFRWITGSWQHFWILALPFIAVLVPAIITATIASTIWPDAEMPLPSSLGLPKWFRSLPHYRMLNNRGKNHAFVYQGEMPEDELDYAEECMRGDAISPFDKIKEKATNVTVSGGLAAVGVGTSKTVHLALDKAQTRGRTELAHILETKVESLKRDFSEELGAADGAELNKLFSAASRQIASQVLRGAVPKDLRYSVMDGMATAWALMVVDPAVIVDAFDNQASKHPDIYKRFRVSQAYKELVADVEAFDEFKRQNLD